MKKCSEECDRHAKFHAHATQSAAYNESQSLTIQIDRKERNNMSISRLLKQVLAAACIAQASMYAHADLTINVTNNTTLGGTDWAFSGGSGTYNVSSGFGSPIFFVGDTTTNPLAFDNNNPHCQCGGVTVLAGTNSFGFVNIFSGAYNGIPGTLGSNIPHALDFQTFTNVGPTVNMAALNGLVLNLQNMNYASFNPGSYILNNYYTGYGTDFGTVTLNIGPVPEPETYAMMLAGLGLLGWMGRRGKQKLVAA
jgi:PEP-CTERM motif